MFNELSKMIASIGDKWFRAFVFVLGCLWIWHTFFSSIAEVGTAAAALEHIALMDTLTPDTASALAQRLWVERLVLTNFRNYVAATFAFNAQPVVLIALFF